MHDLAENRSAAARIARGILIVAIAVGLFWGISLALEPFGGSYKLYIALEFVFVLLATMLLWRAGLGRALKELGIAHLSPLGCLCCLAAIAAALAILLYAGAKWTPQPIGSLLVFGVAGPFVEEVLFRGFAFRQMRRWAGLPFWIAAIVSSVLFGAGHFDAGNSLSNALMNCAIAFAGGILFCWLAERWNSIWPGFIIHAGLNLVWSLFTLGENAVGGGLGNVARLAAVAVAIAATFALARSGFGSDAERIAPTSGRTPPAPALRE